MSSRPIGIGFVGHSWIARVHAHAVHTISHLAPLRRPIRLVTIAGRNAHRTAASAEALGFGAWTTDWRRVVDDPEVDVVASLGPDHLHAEVSIAALEGGKHLLCEKPLGLTSLQTAAVLAGAEAASGQAVCGFNYRFVPAIRLARQVLDEGRLGRVLQLRGAYLQDWAGTAALPANRSTGGAVAAYSHLVDMLRHLVGDPLTVTAVVGNVRTDPSSTSSAGEDIFAAAFELPGGAVATLEASRSATGRKGYQAIEIYGSAGSLLWNMESLNRLRVFLAEDERSSLGGFRDVMVTEPTHPFLEPWWTPGHTLGWDAAFVHQWRDFLDAVVDERPISALQAGMLDGHHAAVIGDAIHESAREGHRVAIAPVAGAMAGSTGRTR